MAAVNKIDITCIAVTKSATANKFDIDISWDVDDGALSYTGSFWLIPYYDGGNDTLIEILYNAQQKRSRKLTGVALDSAKTYAFALTAVKTTPYTNCEAVPITTKTFEGIGIQYENDIVIVGWNHPHATIRSGLMRLEFSDIADVYDYGVDNGLHLYTFAIPEAWLDSHCYRMPLPSSWFTQKTCSVSMFPYADDIAVGPVSEKVTLALQPLKITSVGLGVIASNARSVTVNLSGTSVSYVQLAFYEGVRLVHLSTPIAYSTSITYTLLGQFAHNAERYEIAAYISDSSAKTYNRRKTADNTILLAPPKLSADISAPGKVTLNWTHNAPDCTSYTVGSTTVYGNSYTTTNANLDTAITLTPKYGEKSGIAASIKPFCEGFYTSGGTVSYRGTAFATKGFNFTLSNSGVTEDVIKTEFNFEKTSGKVTVSADNPTRADFLDWLKQLFEKGLTAAAYYKIRGIFSRLLTTTEADRLWYMAGIDPNTGRRADIMPGMTIRVESAQYMPQTSATAENLAGYVPSSVADYTIGLESGFLTASPYLNKTLGHFDYMGEPYKDPLFHASAGGMDFYHKDIKQSYWVLQYPNSFSRSESTSNMYTTANTALFALQNFSDTETLDSDTQYHIVFRARSTVSLFYTVFVNNTPRLVPVGSTIADLLSSLGRVSQTPKLYRNTGFGNMAEVFWIADTTYLIQGDNLEV